MIVLDASATLEFLLRTPIGIRLETEVLGHHGGLHAPHVLDLEVVQVLRRLVSSRELSVVQAEDVLTLFDDLGIIRYGHDLLRPRIWQLRVNLNAYDASYVALAEVLGVPLMTCDRKIASTRSHAAVVRLVR